MSANAMPVETFRSLENLQKARAAAESRKGKIGELLATLVAKQTETLAAHDAARVKLVEGFSAELTPLNTELSQINAALGIVEKSKGKGGRKPQTGPRKLGDMASRIFAAMEPGIIVSIKGLAIKLSEKPENLHAPMKQLMEYQPALVCRPDHGQYILTGEQPAPVESAPVDQPATVA